MSNRNWILIFQLLIKKTNFFYLFISSISKKTYPKIKLSPLKDQKRILITGGAGFVGSHLVDRLMLEGHQVIVADNFFTGSKSSIEHWIGHPNFELINHDIVNPLFIEGAYFIHYKFSL